MSLRRAVSPLEVPLSKLANRQVDVVPEAMRSYFRDVSTTPSACGTRWPGWTSC